MRIEVLGGEEGLALFEPLDRAVYTPQIMAGVIWRDVVWAEPDKRVFVHDAGGAVCHVGLFFRDGTWNGAPARMCGIGGVMTAMDARRKGFAGAAMRRAVEEMAGADFGVLFCEAHNVPLYAALGWRVFDGTVHCVQPSGPMTFYMMPTMILPLKTAPQSGTIDLCGLPW